MPDNLSQATSTFGLNAEQAQELASRVNDLKSRYLNNRSRRQQVESQAKAVHLASGGSEWDYRPVPDQLAASEIADTEYPITLDERRLVENLGIVEPVSQRQTVYDAPVSTSGLALGISRIVSGGTNLLWESGEPQKLNWYDKVAYSGIEKGMVGGTLNTFVGAANMLGVIAENNPIDKAIRTVAGIDRNYAAELRVQTMNWIDQVQEDISPTAASKMIDPNAMFRGMGKNRKPMYYFETDDPDKEASGFFSVDGISEVMGNVGAMLFAGTAAGKILGGIGSDAASILKTQRSVGSLFALSEAGQFERQVYKMALDKGSTPDQARTYSSALSMAFLPFSYFIESSFSPETRLAARAPRGESWYGKVIAAAIGNGIEEGASQEVQGLYTIGANLLEPRQEKDGTTTSPFMQVQQDVLAATGIGAFSGVWFGGVDGVIHSQSRESFNAYNDRLHELGVRVLQSGARSTLQQEILATTGFSLTSNDTRKALVTLDRFVQARANKKGISVDEALSEILVNAKERAATMQSPDYVLYSSTDEAFSSYSRLEDILHSEEMVQSFGKKKADPDALYAYLKSKGAKDLELETVLGPLMSQAKERNAGATKGQEPVKYSIDDLREASKKRRVQISKMVLTAEGDAQYTKLAEELNGLYEKVEETIDKGVEQDNYSADLRHLRDSIDILRQQMETLQANSKAEFAYYRLHKRDPNYDPYGVSGPAPTVPTKTEQLEADTYQELLINLDSRQLGDMGKSTERSGINSDHFQYRLDNKASTELGAQRAVADMDFFVESVAKTNPDLIPGKLQQELDDVAKKAADKVAIDENRPKDDSSIENGDHKFNLMHVRLNQTLLPDGSRAMFIHEIQSDYAQSSRDMAERDKHQDRISGRESHPDFVDNPTYTEDTPQWMAVGVKTIIQHAMGLGIDRIIFPSAWHQYVIQNYGRLTALGRANAYQDPARYDDYVKARNEYNELEKKLLDDPNYPSQKKIEEKNLELLKIKDRILSSGNTPDLGEQANLLLDQREAAQREGDTELAEALRAAIDLIYTKMNEQNEMLVRTREKVLFEDPEYRKLRDERDEMREKNKRIYQTLNLTYSKVQQLKEKAGRFYSHKSLYETMLIKTAKEVLKSVGIKNPTFEVVQLADTMSMDVENRVNKRTVDSRVAKKLQQLRDDLDTLTFWDSPVRIPEYEENVSVLQTTGTVILDHTDANELLSDDFKNLVDSTTRTVVEGITAIGKYRTEAEVISQVRDQALRVIHELVRVKQSRNTTLSEVTLQETAHEVKHEDSSVNTIGLQVAAKSLESLKFKVVESLRDKIDKLRRETKDITTINTGQALSLKLSPEDKAKILERGFPLYSSNRAAFVWFSQLGKGQILGLKGDATLDDFLHELVHMARRSLIDQGDLAKLERIMGIKNGKWTREDEERFVSVFKTWLSSTRQDRAAVSADMAGLLGEMKSYLKDRIVAIDHAGFGPQLPEELQGVLRRIFVEDSGPIQAMESDIIKLEQKLAAQTQFVEGLTTTSEDKEGKSRRVPLKGEEEEYKLGMVVLKNLQSKLQAQKEALRTTLEKTFEPGQKTHQELLADAAITRQIEAFQAMSNDDIAGLYKGRTMKNLRSWFGSAANKVLDTPVGKLLVAQLDEMEDLADNWSGPFNRALAGVAKQVGKRERDLIGTIERNENDGYGFSLLYALMEPDSVPAGAVKSDPKNLHAIPGFKAVKQILETLFHSQNAYMKSLNMYRRLPSGDIVPTIPLEEFKLPRLMTPEAFTLKDNDLFKLGTIVLKLNGITPTDTNIQGFVREYKESIERRGGFMEGSRSFQYMPHEFKSQSGEWVQIFHTNPVELASTWSRRMAQRFAKIQLAGQSMLTNVSDNQYLMQKMLQMFGADVKSITRQMLIDRAVNLVGWVELNGNRVPLRRDMANAMKNKELVQILMDNDIPTKHDPAALLGMIHNLSPENLFNGIKAKPGTKDYTEIANKRLEDLSKLMQKIGGFDREQLKFGRNGILSALVHAQKRFGTKIEDFVMDKLLAQHVRAGGDGEAFKWLVQRYQGIPIRAMSESTITRIMDFEKNVFNSLMTSLAPIKGVFQFVSTAIKDHNDILDSISMLWKMAADPGKYGSYRDFAIEIGAMKPILNTWGADMTSQLQRVGRMISQGSSALMQQRVAELQNIMSVGLAEKRIQRWNARGGKLSAFERQIAIDTYRLTEGDLMIIDKLGMVPPELAKKAIRNAVRTEQFVTEAAHRRAVVELDPLPGWFLGRFQGFAIGMGRRTAEILKEVKAAVTDAKGQRSAFTAWALTPKGRATTTRLLGVALSALGGSILQQIASNAIKGLPPVPEDEDWWDLILGSLWEAQVMGYATTAISPFGFHNKSEEALVALTPGISAIAGLLNFVLGQGRIGDFPIIGDTGVRDSRLYQFAKNMTPALQAADRRWEYFAYPQRRVNDEARRKYYSWSEKQPWYNKNADNDNPINFESYLVWKEVARGNLSAAGRMAQRYYQNRHADLVSGRSDNPEAFITGLRSSLLNKAPIPVGEDSPRRAKFLSSIKDPDERRRIIQADMKYRTIVEQVAPTED